MFQRPIFQHLLDRLTEPRRFIQVLSGPRQVGKTTLARQVMAQLSIASHYASADAPSPQGPVWLEQQWEAARLQAREDPEGSLLVLDEVQKVSGWSEVVKHLTTLSRDILLMIQVNGSHITCLFVPLG